MKKMKKVNYVFIDLLKHNENKREGESPSLRNKERDKMTKRQIEELEYQFNYYSRRFALYEDERDENRAGMTALQRAVRIFGYKFVSKGMVEMEYKMKYEEYELVEINE